LEVIHNRHQVSPRDGSTSGAQVPAVLSSDSDLYPYVHAHPGNGWQLVMAFSTITQTVSDHYQRFSYVSDGRLVVNVILFMIQLVREIMLGGVKTIVSFSSWDWVTANKWARLPGLPWTVVTAGFVILALPGFHLCTLLYSGSGNLQCKPCLLCS